MYKMIDLCAGIGGIRKGFERTGHYKNVLSAEIDEYAARTYEANFGDDPRNDLTSKEFKRKAAEIGCDILLAGFPCQPFSSQGNREGFSDPTKGTIFFHIKQIIKRTRPKAIFLENVQNIVSHDNGNTIHVILDSLEKKLGYKVIGVSYDDDGKFKYEHSSFVRNTKSFGLPQNRPRAYFVAFDKKLYGKLLKDIENTLPTELPQRLKGSPYLGKSLEQILETQVDIHYYMSATYLETLVKHKARQKKNGNGYGYCILNEGGVMRANANTILATGGSGKERNLIIQPMPTYEPSNPSVQKKKGGLNNQDVRIMTPREWGRLQGFFDYGFVNEDTGEDKFYFPDNVPESQQYKQFGNSVSIPVIETMAEFIYGIISGMNSHTEVILKNYSKFYGVLTEQSVSSCLDITQEQAHHILNNMVDSGIIRREEQERQIWYEFI